MRSGILGRTRIKTKKDLPVCHNPARVHSSRTIPSLKTGATLRAVLSQDSLTPLTPPPFQPLPLRLLHLCFEGLYT